MCVFQDMLNDNITRLKDEIELHKAIEANLTANITQQQGRKIQVKFSPLPFQAAVKGTLSY